MNLPLHETMPTEHGPPQNSMNATRKPLHMESSFRAGAWPQDKHNTPPPETSAKVSFTSSSAGIEAPNFGQFSMLIGSLLLTTLLAVGSAFDARNQCIDQEMYSWLDFLDDDASDMDEFSDQDGRIECLNMFRFVILPVGGATFVFGLLGLLIIHRHMKYLETADEALIPSHLSALLQLLVPLLIIFVGWTLGIFAIMLRPKKDPSGYLQNPFMSLAAVDEMGHIGDNANLYYLSWISQALAMVLVYQVCVDCIRRCKKGLQTQQVAEPRTSSDAISVHQQIQTVLSYTSARRLTSLYLKKRRTWYQFILRLRERSGFWVAAFCSCVVVLASSAYLYVQVLVNVAVQINGNDNFRYRDVCSITKGTDELPEEFCARTFFSVIAGSIASFLCFVAMVLHIVVRRKAAADEEQPHCSVVTTQILPGAMDPESSRWQPRMEFLLSLCLSLLLGLNAVFATGVQGPAATVGNLYYASWLSFLLCLRICLGCLEEIYYVEIHTEIGVASPPKSCQKDAASHYSSRSGSEISLDMDLYKSIAKKERPKRLRKYFFLSIFSTVCAASAWDAADNQEAACTKQQKYMILAPAAVALMSVALFVLCLKPKTYSVVSHICIGGIMSIICFVIWLVDLIITMHGKDSWAVNGIGEMKLANLYYFSWASIITAGLQVMAYFKPFLGNKGKDVMLLVWAGIVKVCFVILGAAYHVWYKIAGTCAEDGNDAVAMSFCSRTLFAMIVAIVGILSGWLVLGTRILGCSVSRESRNRAEAALSIMLVLLFGFAVALITSIGGPGQSVGDLYYSTWLAFWVCIGIFVSCYDQMKQEEIDMEAEKCRDEAAHEYTDFNETFESPN